MDIELRAPQVSVQRECHYHCPVTGKEVSSHRTRRNIMAEHGLIDANDFPPAKVAEKGEKAKAKREEIASGLGKPIYLQ